MLNLKYVTFGLFILVLLICLSESQETRGDEIKFGILLDSKVHKEFDISKMIEFGVKKYMSDKREINNEEAVVSMDSSFHVEQSICDLMTKNIVALFGMHTSNSLNSISSFSDAYHVPYITTAMPANSSKRSAESYQVYFRPQYMNAIFDLVKYFQWKIATYFYSSLEGMDRLQQLIDILSEDRYNLENDFKLNTVEVQNSAQVINVLKNNPHQHLNIILDLSPKETESFFNLSRNINSPTGLKPSVMLVGLNILEMKSDVFNYGGLHVIGLNMIDQKSLKKLSKEWFSFYHTKPKPTNYVMPIEAALLADSAYVTTSVLDRFLDESTTSQIAEKLNCETEPLKSWTLGEKFIKALKKADEPGLFTGNVRFDEFGLRTDYKFDIINTNKKSGSRENLGVWDSRSGITIHPHAKSALFKKGYTAISNKTRIVTSILTTPYVMMKNEPGLVGNDRYEGYCVDLLKMLADKVGFEYIIELVDDSKFGARNENGEWNGMIGELLRGEADLAVAPLTITAEREAVVDFSKPFMSVGISTMIKRPYKSASSIFQIFYPFSFEVWSCIVLAFVGVSVVLFLVSKITSQGKRNDEDQSDAEKFTLRNSFWYSIACLLLGSVNIEPKSISGRMVSGVWWFFIAVIFSAYLSKLFFFSNFREDTTILSAFDLSKQTEIKYGAIAGGSTSEFFQRSTIPVYERMWAFMSATEPSVFVNSAEEGVNRVRSSNGKYAFITETSTIDYESQRKPCDVMKIGESFVRKGYGIATPLGSDLRDRVTIAILELMEIGELQQLEMKWWYDKGECTRQKYIRKTSSPKSVKFSQISGLVYIFILALVLALFIAVFQFLYSTRISAKQKKTKFSREALRRARSFFTGKLNEQSASSSLPSDETPGTSGVQKE